MAEKKVLHEEVKHELDHNDREIEVRVRYLKSGEVTVAGYFVESETEVPGTKYTIAAKEASDPELLKHKLGHMVYNSRSDVMRSGRTG
ncbi:hypothetical protein ACEPUD_32415 [Burkholderia ubonensis]|uniref:hypothetical protein n=1 Tax=Burkholderia ubonensis TaxID=101571 RepID=UPI00358E9C72